MAPARDDRDALRASSSTSVSRRNRHSRRLSIEIGAQRTPTCSFALVERAERLGWPRDRVVVIDDDLDKSGVSSDERHGFQQLIAEIGLGHAGLVVSLDASRLARNNSDWHRLLELYGLFETLIADAERVYDPRAYHDRHLLGLSGIMSEAELLHHGRPDSLRRLSRHYLPLALVRTPHRPSTGQGPAMADRPLRQADPGAPAAPPTN